MTTENPWDTGTETATMTVPKPAKLKMYAGDSVYVTLRGRLGTDIDLSQLPSGSKVARGRMAVSRRGRDDAGIWHDVSTTWYTVKMWNQLAENASLSLFKGQPVLVTGRLEVNEWSNPDTGNRGTELIVTAQSIGHDLNLGTSNFVKLKKEGYQGSGYANGGNGYNSQNSSGYGQYANAVNSETSGNSGKEGATDSSADSATEASDPLGVGQTESALV